MTMMKQTAMALGICAMALTMNAATADAGNGKKHRHFKHWHSKHFHIDHHWSHRGCWKYKKKFHRTGKHFWLKKYHACKIFYDPRW